MSATQRFIRYAFGLTGTRTAVPDPVQGDGSVSYQDGYGLDYQRQKTDPLSKNIERDKMNQVLYDLSLNQQQYQLNGVPEFVPAADNGGVAVSYGIGARVLSAGRAWVSRIAANVAAVAVGASWAYVRDFLPRATAAGTVDAITATFAPTLGALQDGEVVAVRASGANTITAPTFNADALGAKTIVKGNNLPLVAGDILGAGAWLLLAYDATLDKWVLQNPATVGRYIGRRVITSTQTYTPTPGTTFIDVTVVGGGGSGGGAAATGVGQASAGAGGGGGGWARKRITAAFSGVTCTVGAGGGPANNVQNGFAGGASSFGALVSANGGSGGTWGVAQGNAVTISGAGQAGAGTVGDVLGSGGIGTYSVYAPNPSSGTGGSSIMGGGAIFATSAVGIAATSPGAGGSGGSATASSGGANSGAGAAGIIIIEEYA